MDAESFECSKTFQYNPCSASPHNFLFYLYEIKADRVFTREDQ